MPVGQGLDAGGRRERGDPQRHAAGTSAGVRPASRTRARPATSRRCRTAAQLVACGAGDRAGPRAGGAAGRRGPSSSASTTYRDSGPLASAPSVSDISVTWHVSPPADAPPTGAIPAGPAGRDRGTGYGRCQKCPSRPRGSSVPRIAIIGSGFAGMGLGIQLKQQGIDTFTIFEKADAVGGTWRANTYPGAECDIPSALYSYSFENFDWPNKWSHQPVIRDYLEHCADVYGLRAHIRLRDAGHPHGLGRGGGCLGRRGPPGRRRSRRGALRRRRLGHRPAQPTPLARHRRPRLLRRTGLPLGRVGPLRRPRRASGSPRSAPAPAPCSTCPRSRRRRRRSRIFQRSPNWVIPKNDRDYSEPREGAHPPQPLRSQPAPVPDLRPGRAARVRPHAPAVGGPGRSCRSWR